MISSQLHRAKQSTLPPGHPPATAPFTRSCLPTPHCRRAFRLLPTALARLRTPIAPISPPQCLSSPIYATIDAPNSIVVPAPLGATPPAISCLGASRTPPVAARG